MTETTIPEVNPSNSPDVDKIKHHTEALMELVRKLDGNERCKAIALTNYEQAAMWAVKSLFVK